MRSMAVRTLLQDIQLVPEHQDFDLQLPWRFETVAQHADEQEADRNHSAIMFRFVAGGESTDGVFGSDGPGPPKPNICALMSTRPKRRGRITNRASWALVTERPVALPRYAGPNRALAEWLQGYDPRWVAPGMLQPVRRRVRARARRLRGKARRQQADRIGDQRHAGRARSAFELHGFQELPR